VTDTSVTIYTDGSSLGNPGPGGWGALLRVGAAEKELSGGDNPTTNNRMELTAAIMGLESLTRPSVVKLYTDSQYVQKGITEWLPGWIKRDWKTADRKPVKNADLWRRLNEAQKKHTVDFIWVRGHDGHPENERVDRLAVAASMAARSKR